MLIRNAAWLALLTMTLTAGCQLVQKAPAGPAGALADIPAEELRQTLADFARSHDQKMQLSFYVSLPFNGVDKPFQAFYSNMGKVHRDLLSDLEKVAKAHGINLTHRFGQDLPSQALTIMEARQEKLIRADGKEDFPRDSLMQMYADYEWQISLIEALLPKVKNADLRTYLENSLRVHETGSREIMGLLKQYKFAGSK